MDLFELPPVAATPDPDVEIRPVYVEEWVEELPYADPEVVARRLLRQVAALNRSPLKPDQRWQLLELCFAALVKLVTGHVAEVSGAVGLSQQAARSRAQALQPVAREFGFGYKRVVMESDTGKTWLGRARDTNKAFHRAAYCNVLLFLLAAQEYAPTPKGIWREAYTLYRLAEKQGIANTAADVGRLGLKAPASPEHLFKALLLTSLLDPHHLGLGEVWSAFRLMSRHCHGAEVYASPPENNRAGYFQFALDQDTAPGPMIGSAPASGGERRYLSTLNVVSALKSAVKETTDDLENTSARIVDRRTRALTRFAIRNLGLRPKRLLPRQTRDGRVWLMAGLPAIHHFLGIGDPSAKPERSVPESDQEINLDAFSAGKAAPVTIEQFDLDTWDLADQCASGVGVIKHQRPMHGLRVGEVIGLDFKAGEQPQGRWLIGAIRWLNISSDTDYHAGVQILAPRARPVSLQHIGSTRIAINALVTPKTGNASHTTLIVPTGTCKPDQDIMLKSGEKSTAARTDVLLESTLVYERYRLQLTTG